MLAHPTRGIDALVCGYAAVRRSRKGLCVLQAYSDDSGSHTGDKRLFLAGYIHRADDWRAFSDDWKAALDEAPTLKSLHMVESFRGWSTHAREEKLERLAAVIAKYKPISIECSISTKDFRDSLRAHVPYDLRHAYGYCFHVLVVKSAELVGHYGLEGPLDFIFDEQGSVGLNSILWYPIMKQLASPAVKKILGGTPVFKSDEDVLPLQAADMLAWHRRVVREPTCKAHDRVVAEKIVFRHATVDVPRELILAWAEAFSKEPGIEQSKTKRGSIKHYVADIVDGVPPERLIPVMEAVSRHGRRMQRLKAALERVGLRRLWMWIAKRKVTFR